MRSVSSTRFRCAWTLWAVSGNPSGIPGSTMGLATGTSARLREGTTSAGHLARRHAGGGRDASWRMHVAAVACRETADRAVHSVAPREDTPRPLDATLACHRRRPTSTRSRPTTVSTRAWHRHNGASVRRTLTEYSHATPHALGVHHARLRGRSQRMLRPTNNTLFGGHRG